MEHRRDGEVSRLSDGDLRSRQSTAAISSLNEVWFRTLDEYVIDTPLNEVLLPYYVTAFLAGQLTRFCCCKTVTAIRSLPISPASLPKSRRRDPPSLHIRH